jgi:hypothetical protein
MRRQLTPAFTGWMRSLSEGQSHSELAALSETGTECRRRRRCPSLCAVEDITAILPWRAAVIEGSCRGAGADRNPRARATSRSAKATELKSAPPRTPWSSKRGDTSATWLSLWICWLQGDRARAFARRRRSAMLATNRPRMANIFNRRRWAADRARWSRSFH